MRSTACSGSAPGGPRRSDREIALDGGAQGTAYPANKKGLRGFVAVLMLVIPVHASGQTGEDSLTAIDQARRLQADITALRLATDQCAEPSNREASGCQYDDTAEVIHFPQMHWRPEFEGDAELLLLVARSQFQVARFLLTHPDAEVFVEGLYEDATEQQMAQLEKDPDSLVPVIRAAFPEGLSRGFDELSNQQLYLLAKLGAPVLLYALGDRRQLRKTVTPVQDDKFWSAVEKRGGLTSALLESDPEIRQAVFTQRERFAAAQVRSYLSEAGSGGQAVLVYGAAHDFRDDFSDMGFTRVFECGAPSVTALTVVYAAIRIGNRSCGEPPRAVKP